LSRLIESPCRHWRFRTDLNFVDRRVLVHGPPLSLRSGPPHGGLLAGYPLLAAGWPAFSFKTRPILSSLATWAAGLRYLRSQRSVSDRTRMPEVKLRPGPKRGGFWLLLSWTLAIASICFAVYFRYRLR
jgi:hypothetical protein